MIYEMLQENEQEEIINKHEMSPFEVNVLSPKRTICEKIMSLVRFSFSENPIEDLNNKIRHIYDLNMLLKDKQINDFFISKEFDKMLIKVGKDDMLSYKNNNEWLQKHPASAIIFENPEEIWKKLRNTYYGNFKELVYGEFPAEKDILNTLKTISKRLRKIEWNI